MDKHNKQQINKNHNQNKTPNDEQAFFISTFGCLTQFHVVYFVKSVPEEVRRFHI